MGTGYSVAILKERFAQAARGKENVGVVVGKPVIEKQSTDTATEEDDEPLLVENNKRFVLFPIKYHEVHLLVVILSYTLDLANVQESRSFFLDC